MGAETGPGGQAGRWTAKSHHNHLRAAWYLGGDCCTRKESREGCRKRCLVPSLVHAECIQRGSRGVGSSQEQCARACAGRERPWLAKLNVNEDGNATLEAGQGSLLARRRLRVTGWSRKKGCINRLRDNRECGKGAD